MWKVELAYGGGQLEVADDEKESVTISISSFKNLRPEISGQPLVMGSLKCRVLLWMWEEAQEGQRVDGLLLTSSQGLGDLGHVGLAVNVFLLSLFALQHFNCLSRGGTPPWWSSGWERLLAARTDRSLGT